MPSIPPVFFRERIDEARVDATDRDGDFVFLADVAALYDRAVGLAPFDEQIRRERAVVRAAAELRRSYADERVSPDFLASLDASWHPLIIGDDLEAAIASAPDRALREAGLLLFLARPGQTGSICFARTRADATRTCSWRACSGSCISPLARPVSPTRACGRPTRRTPIRARRSSRLAEAAVGVGDDVRARRLLERAVDLPALIRTIGSRA